jgi:hypothetical protein
MSDGSAAITCLEELRTFVHQTLCERENLLIDQSPLTESPLTRRGRLCGLEFSVRGPRAVRLSAIWAADLNIVYFYDVRGERFLKVQLPYRFSTATTAVAA